MKSEAARANVKPDRQTCPERFCFHWLRSGSQFAAGLYNDLDDALKDMTIAQGDLCGCTFGVCKRLDSINGDHDWYEPHEPALEEIGLPWFYFIPSPEKVVDDIRRAYIRESESLWGVAHWKE